MKKILLATTMLAGTAGFAAAQESGVTVSGYAEIGILGTQDAFGDSLMTLHQDVEVTFTMSGETDSGLSFGASIDLDEGDVELLDDSGTTVFVSGAFGTLTMGDTDGALDWAVQDAGALTSMGDDHTTHNDYFAASGFDASHDNQVLRYEYSFGQFGIAVSYEQAANGAGLRSGATVSRDLLTGEISLVNGAGPEADDNIGIGVTYSADMGGTALRFGLAYQRGSFIDESVPDLGDLVIVPGPSIAANTTITVTNGEAVGVSAGAEFAGGFSGSIGYIDFSLDGVGNDFSQTGLGLTYTIGALSLHANYGETDREVGVDTDSYGLAVNYDLGGGAVAMAGYGSDLSGAAGNQDQYSIGLGLTF